MGIHDFSKNVKYHGPFPSADQIKNMEIIPTGDTNISLVGTGRAPMIGLIRIARRINTLLSAR
jgi:hypothetical protein